MSENETPQAAGLNIFVTDGIDCAGLSTVKALASAGHKVSAVVQTTAQAEKIRALGGLPVFVDLTRPGEIAGTMKMAGATIIANTASQAFNQVPVLGDMPDRERLIMETQAIVSAAESAGTSLLIHTSFTYLYASGQEGWLTEEAALSHEKHGIIAAGRKAEQIVMASSVDACILRAGFCYGPGGTVLQAAADALQFGRGLVAGDDHTMVNFVHSDDLAQAIRLAAESNAGGEIFNIVDDSPSSLVEFLGNLGTAIGLGNAVNVGGGLMSKLGLSRQDNPLVNLSSKICNDKAKDLLGLKLKYTNHVQGIDQTTISWRAAMKMR